ncbi:hypothetical protein K505DRAFT_337852 [Melanomma pulvis-pyrius CBS 109.77]|uniref:Myb-like domain-containing protein n=1 Tax=Melanomma pulvis-pyrius CBS 109.77 TaxID=1314802 RepID=A0A6A6X9Y6_9PLEO|nr:hypothetical protein K505DRAFT_337852 [Melanomma pulvis-pyrius CBS 109.77]
MDINLLIHPQDSESPRSSTSPVRNSIPPSHISALPECPLSSPAYGAASTYSTPGTSLTPSLAQGSPVDSLPRSLMADPQAPNHFASQTTSIETSFGRIRAWTPAEDVRLAILRNQGVKWSEVPNFFTGRSEVACQMRHKKVLAHWSRERKRRFEALFDRHMTDMFANIQAGMAMR